MTVPVTGVALAPAPTLKLVELMVEGFIASLKVAVIDLFVHTPDESAVGETVGAERPPTPPSGLVPAPSPNSTSFPPQAISDDAHTAHSA